MLFSKLSDNDHDEFFKAVNRLTEQPFSYKYKDLIMKYRKSEGTVMSENEFVTPLYDEHGRAYVEQLGNY